MDEFLEAYGRAQLGMTTDEKDEPEDVPLDFGLHDPRWYVQRAWLDLRAHGNYPHGGALDTLPRRTLEDLNALDARYARIYRRLLVEREIEWEEKRSGIIRDPKKLRDLELDDLRGAGNGVPFGDFTHLT